MSSAEARAQQSSVLSRGHARSASWLVTPGIGRDPTPDTGSVTDGSGAERREKGWYTLNVTVSRARARYVGKVTYAGDRV